MYVKSFVGIALVSGLAFAVSCGTKKEDKTTGNNESEVKALGLSGMLNVKVPDSVSGKTSSTNLLLATRKKSWEACELRDKINDAMTQVANMGSTVCQVESLPNLELGKKYQIKFPEASAGSEQPPSGGEQPPPAALNLTATAPKSIEIFVDQKKDGGKVIFLCTDQKLNTVIKMKKDGDVAKGRFVFKDKFTVGGVETSFHTSGSFKQEGKKTNLAIKDKVTTKGSGDQNFELFRLLLMKLDEDGISTVKSSEGGQFSGQTMNFMSAAKFGKDFGSVLQIIDTFKKKSYFDGNSVTVNKADHLEQFGDGKPYFLSARDMPKRITSSTLSPDEFPANAWNCQDTEELSMEGASDSANSCSEDGFEMPEQSCTDADFIRGEDVVLDESDFVDPAAIVNEAGAGDVEDVGPASETAAP